MDADSEKLPGIDKEVALALIQMKNKRAPKEDGIIKEMIVLGSRVSLEVITSLMNKYLQNIFTWYGPGWGM